MNNDSILVYNILETFRPRTVSGDQWNSWLVNSDAGETEIDDQIRTMAKVDIGRALGLDRDSSGVLGLGHPSLFPILQLLIRELNAPDDSNLVKMYSRVHTVHVGFALKAKTKEKQLELIGLNLRSAEILGASGLLIRLLYDAKGSSQAPIKSRDWDKSLCELLSFQIHITLTVLAMHYGREFFAEQGMMNRFLPIAVHGTQIAQKFAANEPLEFEAWRDTTRHLITNSKDRSLSKDLLESALLRIAPHAKRCTLVAGRVLPS